MAGPGWRILHEIDSVGLTGFRTSADAPDASKEVDAAFDGTLARARALLAYTDAGRDDAVLLKHALELLIETEEELPSCVH